MTAPRATYRLQLHKGFGFADAARAAPYLGRLGVSHAYLSPWFKARPGSTHGYDIVNHAELNPELGTEEDYKAMIAAFEREGVKRLLDFVPNHMGVGGADNPFWLDVLEWGRDSAYAGWFDIDWAAQGGKLLAPVLGAQYGEELKGGKLKLRFEEDGGFAIWAYESHKLPVCPLSYAEVLGHTHPLLDRMGDLFLDLPNWRPEVSRRARALKGDLATAAADPGVRAAIDARLALFNSDWRELERLIAAQNWRVAFFRVAEDEINYRRFFNINDLAGLRMEIAPVFEEAHRRVFAMLQSGEIDGLRIDHIDGLFDPKAYLTELRERGGEDFYLVVEKILAFHEQLRPDWPIDGTTGYEYLNLSLGVLIDPAGEAGFSEAYRDFAGGEGDFETVARVCKLRIMDNEMASELNALSRAAARLAKQSPMTADLTRGLLQRAIEQVVASFPVYRTYLDFEAVPTEADMRDIAWAITRARKADPDVHPSAFDFLHSVLTADVDKAQTMGLSAAAALRLAMRLQQYSGPVMAKGVEDTAFYRFNRFVALNEVGGAPERFGLTLAAFHRANAMRAERWPHAMLATTTHDTKRGEDARARLAALSEMPDEWRKQVASWSRLLRARRGDVEGQGAPDRSDEYFFYQMLVGAWPMELIEETSPEALSEFGTRIAGALEKSMREAKRHSSWAAPNAEYEGAMQSLAKEALHPDGHGFLLAFLPFVRRLARLGVENSLVQTALKLTVPGVPDIYQGCDLWDFSLVDPDNRRPVDLEARAALLSQLPALEGRHAWERLMEEWRDGRIKLALTARLLDLRRRHADLFAEGSYQPLGFEGEQADVGLGFMRQLGDRKIALLAARFPARRESAPEWDARFTLPEGDWRDGLSGEAAEGGSLRATLGKLPVTVLTSGL